MRHLEAYIAAWIVNEERRRMGREAQSRCATAALRARSSEPVSQRDKHCER